MRTTIAGGSVAMSAGAMTTSCPISRKPRTSNAAPTISTAPAVRCRFPTAAPRSALRGLHRGRGRDRHSPQSGFQRRHAGGRRIFPDHDAARPAREHSGAYLRPAKAPRQPARRDGGAGATHPVRGASRGGCRIQQGRHRCGPRGRARKSWSRAAPITRRNCCSSPASGRPNCCASTASMSCSMRRVSATTCRITCRSGS